MKFTTGLLVGGAVTLFAMCYVIGIGERQRQAAATTVVHSTAPSWMRN